MRQPSSFNSYLVWNDTCLERRKPFTLLPESLIWHLSCPMERSGVMESDRHRLESCLPHSLAVQTLTSVSSSVQFSSVQFSSSVVSDSLWTHGLQHARPPCPSPTPRVYPNSWPLSRWCHPTTSSSIIPFSSCPQSFPGSGSFQMLFMRWLNYWSFSFNIGPSNERPGLISFKMD